MKALTKKSMISLIIVLVMIFNLVPFGELTVYADGGIVITVTDDGNGTASASSASGEQGAEITLTATPNKHYKFKEWQVISGGVTITDNKFTLGSSDVEVKAIFENTTFPFTDDFENYDDDTTISSGNTPYTVRYNGSGDGNQKIFTTEQKDGSTGKVLQLQGRSGWASQIKYKFTPDDRQYCVFETDIKIVSGSAPGGVLLCSSQADGYWTSSVCRIILEKNGKVYYGKNDSSVDTNSDFRYSNGNWYHLKLVWDRANSSQFIIIDDTFIGRFPADPAAPEWIELCAGNSGSDTVYFDNVKLYSADTIDIFSVTFETDGGSSIGSQSILSGNKAARPETDPEKTGYVFAGWYKDSALTEEYNFDTNIITSDTTIYAKWNEIHTHNLTIVPEKAATCSSTGNYEYYACSGCTKVFTDASGTVETTVGAQTIAINSAAHDWDAGNVTTPPTCTSDGEKTYTCKNDSEHTKKEPVGKIEHSLVHVEEVAATCTADGNDEYYKCSVCDKYFTDESGTVEIADKSSVVRTKTGHDWGKWTVSTPATEESAGEEIRICKNDSNHKETREIPKLIHTHKLVKIDEVPATCMATGTEEYWSCSGCHKMFSDSEGTNEIDAPVIIEKTAHSWNEGEVTTPATCTTTGVKIYTCTVCKETKIETIEKKSHALETIAAAEPTCETDGIKAHYKCSECNKLFADILGTVEMTSDDIIVPATGHDWGEWFETTPATVDNEGIKTRICKNDSSHKETTTLDRLPADKEEEEKQVTDFVNRLYSLVLDRTPEEAGIDSWKNALLKKESSGVDVGYGFVFSPECVERNLSDSEFVEMLYNTFMNREADEGGKSAWVSQLESGVEREKVFEGFVYSEEFLGICKEYGIEVGNTESVDAFAEALSHYCNQNADVTAFVARCYTKALGREYDPIGLEDWCRVIVTQDDTPTSVAKSFIFSDEFAGKNLGDEEYVKVLYRTFMGREADEGGLSGWVGVLKSGEEDREKVLDGFANSLEFAEILEGFGLN